MTPIPSAIPSAFHDRAINLDHLHVAEVGWKRVDVLEIITALKNSNWAVLGGDVLRSDGQAYRHAYDSWHSDRGDQESAHDFVERSHNEILAYVKRYPENGDVCYVLVFDECT